MLAPANGRVLTVQVVNGTVVMPGDTVATIAADTYVLRMRVPERHARFIREGDRVLVGARGLEATAEKLVEGRVRLVYPELDQGRVVADVDVDRPRRFLRRRTHAGVRRRPARGRPSSFPPAYVYKRFGISYVRGQGHRRDRGPSRPADGGRQLKSCPACKAGDVLLPAEPSP